MATTITFTDAVGAATLKNGRPAPADRFANWNEDPRPIGEFPVLQSNGATMAFLFRTDYGASFELRHIPIAAVGGVRLVEIANRLKLHLMSGGTCAVNTGDASASAYATCGIMPGTIPSVVQSDPAFLEYTFSVSLINLAGSPVPMVCRYA